MKRLRHFLSSMVGRLFVILLLGMAVAFKLTNAIYAVALGVAMLVPEIVRYRSGIGHDEYTSTPGPARSTWPPCTPELRAENPAMASTLSTAPTSGAAVRRSAVLRNAPAGPAFRGTRRSGPLLRRAITARPR